MDIAQLLGMATGKVIGKHPFPEHLLECRKAATEGIVLLKNENSLLPISAGKIALFGAGAIDTILCGTGSGYVMSSYKVNVAQGLKNNGFTLTSDKWLKKFEAASKKANKEDKTLSKIDRMWSGVTILIDEPEITAEELAEAKATDTAIYVVRRNAGEGGDRKAVKGDYYLSDMETANLTLLAENFAHVIVVLNTCVIDANFLNEIPNIEAAVLMGQPGADAGNIIAHILTGKSCPSGRLTDTWTLKYEDNPASTTFAANDGNSLQEDYNEDIFVGYRYFDSYGIEVLYPFGYGLSYTSFSHKVTGFSANLNKVTLKVEVENTGAVAGKDVVQIYASAPAGRLVKPIHELAAYKKTKKLQPGEKQELKITFDTEYLTSYDESLAAFVLEPGDYQIAIGRNSRDTSVAAVIRVEKEICYRQVVSRLAPDHELDIIAPPVYSRPECSDVIAITLDASAFTTIQGFTPAPEKTESVPADMNATLVDVAEGRTSLEAFVNSLDEEVLYRLVTGAADETPYEVPVRGNGKTKPIGGGTSSGATTKLFAKSLGIPEWKVTDGPAGCHLPFSAVTGYPAGMVIAQTFNDNLAYLCGRGIGQELAHYGFSIILGPGMNIHRDPLCGRAFEYYSEDPVISGKMAAAVTRGVQATPGAGVSIKHFAANNQETDRSSENNTITERALREIYLRGFEICVREADPKTVMTSYNKLNGTHTSSNIDLITHILREEWGFKGLVMTDWGTQSVKAYDLIAGNDLIMGGYRSDYLKAAVHGTSPEFADDGYVRTIEQKVYGGFITNHIEFWNVFDLSAEGADTVSTTVAAGKELNPKVEEKVQTGIATVTENADGTKTVTYKGTDRGAYLPLEAVRACAARTLEQILDSVSYRIMKK